MMIWVLVGCDRAQQNNYILVIITDTRHLTHTTTHQHSTKQCVEFLGKTITDHDPILSFLIHNLSPDHAKNDPDHAKNDPKLPNLSKLCGFLEKWSRSWSSFYTCISEKNRIVIRIVSAWSGLKLWIKNDDHRR